MRNRAKCKLCEEIIESFHQFDYVSCDCGEISIDGGEYTFGASAKNFANFLRIDDNDKEVAVKFQAPTGEVHASKKNSPYSHELTEEESMMSASIKVGETFSLRREEHILESFADKKATWENLEPNIITPTKQEKLAMLDNMIKSYENLPQQAMHLPVNHYDFVSFMILVQSLFREG